MTEPIFVNLGQALHFSFLMELIPASNKGASQIAFEHLMENSGRVFDSGPPSTINMKGLSIIEIRGQCAMVRSLVEDHLLAPEKYALWARYGQYDNRAKVYTKMDGVEGIAHYVEPACLVKGDALLELAGNFYNLTGFSKKGHRKPPPTMRQIAKKYEIDLAKLARTKRVIGQKAAQLEIVAFGRLYELLKNKELAEILE